jgi:acyl carrier protein
VLLGLLGADVTREQISEFCIACLAKVLRISKDSVETDTKFSRIGLDSAMVVYIMMDLEEGLGLELSPDDFYDHPTVNALSAYLAERFAQRSAA